MCPHSSSIPFDCDPLGSRLHEHCTGIHRPNHDDWDELIDYPGHEVKHIIASSVSSGVKRILVWSVGWCHPRTFVSSPFACVPCFAGVGDYTEKCLSMHFFVATAAVVVDFVVFVTFVFFCTPKIIMTFLLHRHRLVASRFATFWVHNKGKKREGEAKKFQTFGNRKRKGNLFACLLFSVSCCFSGCLLACHCSKVVSRNTHNNSAATG